MPQAFSAEAFSNLLALPWKLMTTTAMMADRRPGWFRISVHLRQDMWHMIETDVLARSRPGRGKLRLIVVTDGHDTQSPAEYNGRRGMHPMMRTLHAEGYDVEWHIVVLGDVEETGSYQALAGATGGTYLAIDEFDEERSDVARFLQAIDDSSCHDARRARQQRYLDSARTGAAERVEWFKALPGSTGNR